MRLCSTVIYTDKLSDVRAFYERYFAHWLNDSSNPHAFSVMVFGEVQLMWIDAASANAPTTHNAMIRISIQHPQIEYAHFSAKGAPCDPLTVEDWGPAHGAVQFFTVHDPSGTRLLFFADHYGEARQLMLTGSGVGTREVQHTPGKSTQSPSTNLILHMTTRSQWERAKTDGLYRSDTLDTEGFTHCSTPQQIVGTANRFYHGRRGLVLLCIDQRKVQPEVRYEPPSGDSSQLFPHIYGPLNVDAVIAIPGYEPDGSGTFAAPNNLPTLD